MNSALVFSWKRAEPGREAKALEVLAESQMFWGKLAAEGKVAEPELFMSLGHNLMVIRGDWDFLFQTLHTDECITLLDKATFVASDLSYHFYDIGQLAEHELQLFATAGSELGYL